MNRFGTAHNYKAIDGTVYTIMPNGQRVRRDPKPWKGKSERRQAIKERRAERERITGKEAGK